MVNAIRTEYPAGYFETKFERPLQFSDFTAAVVPNEEEKDYSEEKQTIEETFGGIWIEDAEEFAKFAKAVNNTPFEENGEGVAYTDNYFYAYYRSIDGQPIPFASVYMNEHESQDIVNEILRDGGEKKTAREWFDWFNAHARNVKSKNDAVVGSDKKARNTRTNGRLDSELSRYGAYYDSPELFVKSKRTYKGSRINYSLITPESIRKRKALLGKSKEEHDAFMNKWGDVYAELATKLHTT